MVTGALAVLALVLVVFRSGPPDPFYRGRRLSDYLDGFAGDGMQQNQEPPFGLVIIFQDTTDRRGSAWEASPKISNLVNDPDRRISEAAKEALRQVDPVQSQPDRSKSQ